jgi:hypothetical protein
MAPNDNAPRRRSLDIFLNEIGKALKSLFAVVSEDSRSRLLLNLVGESQNDKVSSLVHL